MDAKARRAQLARFGRDASRPTDGPGVVHRRALAAGAPSSLPDPGRFPRRKRRLAAAAVHRMAFKAAKRAGAKRVTLMHPGASGHERCRVVCITYS
jgi:hypothetical protein